MKVVCDKCKKYFKIKPKTKNIEEDLKLHYFECPKCSNVYEINKSNTITRKLQSKLTHEDMKGNSDLYKEYQEEFKKINKKEDK